MVKNQRGFYGYPLAKAKYHPAGDLIENIQVFEIVKIITDIKLMYETYLIFSVAVKSESRKIWPPINQKGKSMFQIHPFEL